MGLLGATYNLDTFISACAEIEHVAEETLRRLPPTTRQFLVGMGAQKLSLEYEHFTIHQRLTVDRLAFMLNYFFKCKNLNMVALGQYIQKVYVRRPDLPEHSHAKAVFQIIEKHQGFLAPIHSPNHGEIWTERDTIVHRNFISFTSVSIQVHPKLGLTVIIPAFIGAELFNLKAQDLLQQRFNELLSFTLDLLNAFYDYSE